MTKNGVQKELILSSLVVEFLCRNIKTSLFYEDYTNFEKISECTHNRKNGVHTDVRFCLSCRHTRRRRVSDNAVTSSSATFGRPQAHCEVERCRHFICAPRAPKKKKNYVGSHQRQSRYVAVGDVLCNVGALQAGALQALFFSRRGHRKK